MKVSVVIPCYNHAKYLSEALESILEQTYQNWECIIVNDGSTDNTELIANEWTQRNIKFNYYLKKNGGLSSARNLGIKMAQGDYILTLDSDDKFERSFISKAVELLNTEKQIGIVSCWGYRLYSNNDVSIFKPEGKNLNDFLFKNAAIGNSLFRKQCWTEVNGFDEQMKKGYEDWEFYLNVSKNGWQTKIIEEPLFFYRQHEVSMRVEAVAKFDKEIKSYIFKKHKALYIENFEETIETLLSLIELNKNNELKRINSIDYRIGNSILKPFRYLKKIIKK